MSEGGYTILELVVDLVSNSSYHQPKERIQMAEYEIQMRVVKWIATTVIAKNLDKAIEIAETQFRDGNYDYVEGSEELTYEYWARNEQTQESGFVEFEDDAATLKDE